MNDKILDEMVDSEVKKIIKENYNTTNYNPNYPYYLKQELDRMTKLTTYVPDNIKPQVCEMANILKKLFNQACQADPKIATYSKYW